jgi:hypothetical protein
MNLFLDRFGNYSYLFSFFLRSCLIKSIIREGKEMFKEGESGIIVIRKGFKVTVMTLWPRYDRTRRKLTTIDRFMVSSEIICDDVIQRLFWMISSYTRAILDWVWRTKDYGGDSWDDRDKTTETDYDQLMASSEIICDDVTQRLFWMMSSYKGYFWNLVEYGEQQRRTTVKIREMMTQIRRLREVSNKEKSYALHQFKNDFRWISKSFLQFFFFGLFCFVLLD